MFLEQAAGVIYLILKILTLWFAVTSVFFLKKLKKFERSAPRTRFACIIAARNEEKVIPALMESLEAQDYPRELFDVYVVPNNCTDGTEMAAVSCGAKIIKCQDPVKCKGDVLHQAVAWLMDKGYDAYCVFDADNVVDRGFLAAMNDAFLGGAKVAKSRIRIKNPYDTWVSGAYALYYGMFDSIYNRSRAAIGLSAKLVGTGFAFSHAFIEEIGGWNTETLTEDVELYAICAAQNVRVYWVPDAVTYDEAPASFKVSVIQRRRWVSGIIQVAERRLPDVCKGGMNARRLDAAMLLCTPYIKAVSLLPTCLLLVSQGIRGIEPSHVLELLAGAAAALFAGYTGMCAAGLVLAAMCGILNKKMIRGIVLFPIWTASWLPIQITCLVCRSGSWKEIKHTRTIFAKDLV